MLYWCHIFIFSFQEHKSLSLFLLLWWYVPTFGLTVACFLIPLPNELSKLSYLWIRKMQIIRNLCKISVLREFATNTASHSDYWMELPVKGSHQNINYSRPLLNRLSKFAQSNCPCCITGLYFYKFGSFMEHLWYLIHLILTCAHHYLSASSLGFFFIVRLKMNIFFWMEYVTLFAWIQ